jgi:hypothetical protein
MAYRSALGVRKAQVAQRRAKSAARLVSHPQDHFPARREAETQIQRPNARMKSAKVDSRGICYAYRARHPNV